MIITFDCLSAACDRGGVAVRVDSGYWMCLYWLMDVWMCAIVNNSNKYCKTFAYYKHSRSSFKTHK